MVLTRTRSTRPILVDVTIENVDKTGFFCFMSKRKSEGYQRKLAWLKDRFAEGMRIKMCGLPERGFIEYIPGEHAWRAPVPGVVRDRSTRLPVPGAVLSVAAESGQATTAISDARGRYRLGSLPASLYHTYVNAPGYVPGFSGLDADGPLDLRKRSRTHDFAIERVQRMAGRGQDQAGQPVARALVGVTEKNAPGLYGAPQSGGMESVPVWTADDGTFSVALPAGERPVPGGTTAELAVGVLDAGYAAGRSASLNPTALPSHPVVVTLERGLELAGQVRDANGTPIPEVAIAIAEDGPIAGGLLASTVLLRRFDGEGWVRTGTEGRFSTRASQEVGDEPTTLSDDEGHWELAAVRPGTVTLDFRRQGYLSRLAEPPVTTLVTAH